MQPLTLSQGVAPKMPVGNPLTRLGVQHAASSSHEKSASCFVDISAAVSTAAVDSCNSIEIRINDAFYSFDVRDDGNIYVTPTRSGNYGVENRHGAENETPKSVPEDSILADTEITTVTHPVVIAQPMKRDHLVNEDTGHIHAHDDNVEGSDSCESNQEESLESPGFVSPAPGHEHDYDDSDVGVGDFESVPDPNHQNQQQEQQTLQPAVHDPVRPPSSCTDVEASGAVTAVTTTATHHGLTTVTAVATATATIQTIATQYSPSPITASGGDATVAAPGAPPQTAEESQEQQQQQQQPQQPTPTGVDEAPGAVATPHPDASTEDPASENSNSNSNNDDHDDDDDDDQIIYEGSPMPAPTSSTTSPSQQQQQQQPQPPYCSHSTLSLDISSIAVINPDDLDLYLNLVDLAHIGLDPDRDAVARPSDPSDPSGPDPSLLSGDAGARDPVIHTYSVACGLARPPDFSPAVAYRARERQRSAAACVEACERAAVGFTAARGRVAECLGAAWRAMPSTPSPETGAVDGEAEEEEEDNCRFWTGGEDEFLPIEEEGKEDDGSEEALRNGGDDEGRTLENVGGPWGLLYRTIGEDGTTEAEEERKGLGDILGGLLGGR